jgi:hypothetical protein
MRRALLGSLVLLCPTAARADGPAEARQVVLRALEAHGLRVADQPLAMECRYRATISGVGAFQLTFFGHAAGLPVRCNIQDPEPRENLVLCFRAKDSWAIERETVLPLGEGDQNKVAELQAMMHYERVTWLLPLVQDRQFTLALLKESEVDGRPARGVQASYPGQRDVKLYFDQRDGVLVKAESQLRGETFQRRYLHIKDWDATAADEKLLRDAGLAVDGPASLRRLRLQIPTREQQEKVARLIRQLGDDSFEKRQAAGQELREQGEAARAALEAALRSSDAEVVRHARDLLRHLPADQGLGRRLALVRLLAVRKPDGVAAALEEYLPHAKGDPEKREVQAALAALGRDLGPALKEPGRRLYLGPVKVAHQQTWSIGEKSETVVLELLDLQFFNRHPDALFEPPAPLPEVKP